MTADAEQGATGTPRSAPRRIDVPTIAPPRAHYSHAVVADSGRTIYVAGQVPVDVHGEVVTGGAGLQARQVINNLREVLRVAGASFDDVVRTTVYLTDLADRDEVGRVRAEEFGDAPPANTLLVVAALADPRFLVEIDAIAVC